MKKILLSLIFSLFFCKCLTVNAKNRIDSIRTLIALNKQGENTSNILALARAYNQVHNFAKRDSCISQAFFDNQFTENITTTKSIFECYFDFGKLPDTVLSQQLISDFTKLANKEQNANTFYLLNKFNYRVASDAGKLNQKKMFAERMSFYASKTGNDDNKIEALLAVGDVLDQTNNKVEAFRTYTDAIFLAKSTNNDKELINCYEKASQFFELLGQYNQAKEYKQKEYDLVVKLYSKNSPEYFYLLKDFVSLLFKTGKQNDATKLADQVITYANKTNDKTLSNQMFTVYRSYYISNESYGGLKNLYEKKYPNALEELRLSDTAMYLRVRSYIYENDKKTDSAFQMYQIAEKLFLEKTKDYNQISNFYNRYGKVSLSNHQPQLALHNFELALEYANKSMYFPFIIENAIILDSLNKSNGNIEKAYNYSKISEKFKDSLLRLKSGDELLKIELGNAEREKKLMEEHQQQEITRTHNAEYLLIVVLIFSSFLLLLIFASIKINRFFFKIFGFVSFVFLFEFIILVSDNWIHHVTHGSPLKVIMIKLVVISFLLPFHHWLEGKVVHYLIAHELINKEKLSTYIKNKIKVMRNKIRGIKES